MRQIGGYAGKILRVNLDDGKFETFSEDEHTLRKYVGGVGLGSKALYNEVPPGVQWDDPENRLILASGPLAGTTVNGSGTFCVVTKGCITDGATSTQANGFFGAYLKFAGFDELIIQGGIQEGLTQREEQWETEISHPPDHFRVCVIFPPKRPPGRSS